MTGRYSAVYVDGKMRHEHIVVAERIFGGPLPMGYVVHHKDGNRLNNAPENLVICTSQAEHLAIHRRERALAACGNAEWLRCAYCKQYDAPENLALVRSGRNGYHRSCANERRRAIRRNKQ